MKLEDPRFIKSLVEVSHVEFQSYDFFHRHLICTSGLGQKILGYTAAEYRKLSENYYKSIIHPDDWHLVVKNVEDLMHSAHGEVLDMTVRICKANGKYVWIYVRKMVTERDKQGKPSTVTSVIEDITDFIELQDKLNEKVQQLDAISYRNSHTVRGPVTSIIGLVDLIEEESITSQHNKQVFDYLKLAIRKLDTVIREINDLSSP